MEMEIRRAEAAQDQELKQQEAARKAAAQRTQELKAGSQEAATMTS
jgi:hypothetical protein